MRKSEEKECPCKDCIVRASCGNKLVVDYSHGRYLSVPNAKRCPQIIEYLGKNKSGNINFTGAKLRKIFNIFNPTESRSPVGLVGS